MSPVKYRSRVFVLTGPVTTHGEVWILHPGKAGGLVKLGLNPGQRVGNLGGTWGWKGPVNQRVTR